MLETQDDEWNLVDFQTASAIHERKQILEWVRTHGHWSGSGKHIKHSDIKGKIHEHGVLGHGGCSWVERVTFRSVTMARKRIRVKRNVEQLRNVERLREEANIMEKLVHRHIVELVGTYTYGQKDLYILTYPVAACNLQEFLDDIEESRSETPRDITDALKRLEALGFKQPADSAENILDRPLKFLASTVGCVTEAVSFVHNNGVRHQDLKPQNVLLGPGQVHLADFGISRDLKDAQHSLTEGFHGGTLFYLAPEVKRQEEHSMSCADIYSLGCVFFTVASVLYGASNKHFKAIMGEGEPSKKAGVLKAFFDDLRVQSARFGHAAHDAPTCAPKHLLGLIEAMLSEDPKARPTACEVNNALTELGGIDQTYHGKCCKKDAAYVTQLIDKKMKEANEGKSQQSKKMQQLQAQHEADRAQIKLLLKAQETYNSLAERERNRVSEQYQALLERRNKELEVEKAARKFLEVEIAQLRRQKQPQGNARKGPNQQYLNGIDSLAKINGGSKRRASNLPLPVRPSTPLRPHLGTGSRGSSSGNNTLLSSINSAFSKTTVASNESLDSGKSIRSSTPDSLILVRPSMPPSPVLSHGKLSYTTESSNQSAEKATTTWAEMARKPAAGRSIPNRPMQNNTRRETMMGKGIKA